MTLLSIIIPTYMEHQYVVKTLIALSRQSVWNSSEVIIADYDPQSTNTTINLLRNHAPTTVKSKVKFMSVDKKGIGYARHLGALQATGSYLMSFDADARFQDADGAHRLMAPLMNGECVMTHCNVNLESRDPANKHLLAPLYGFRNDTQASGLSVRPHEVGLTMTKEAYMDMGGYPDIKAYEGAELAVRVMRKYGPSKIKYINSVVIRVSGRRLSGSGLGVDTNYDIAYR